MSNCQYVIYDFSSSNNTINSLKLNYYQSLTRLFSWSGTFMVYKTRKITFCEEWTHFLPPFLKFFHSKNSHLKIFHKSHDIMRLVNFYNIHFLQPTSKFVFSHNMKDDVCENQMHMRQQFLMIYHSRNFYLKDDV